MTPQSNLDLSGDFRTHPFAELIVEIVQAKLTGSLRVARATKKTIIYFRDGAIVFGVSNVREHRLFHRLLKENRIVQSDLHNCPGLGNDMELAVWLQNKGLIASAEISEAFVSQIAEIIIDAITWPDGQWVFSASARLRSDLNYRIDVFKLLLDYARCVSGETVMSRFKSVHETFVRQIDNVADLLLQPQEACVLEAFGNTPLKFDQLRGMLNMPESGLAQALYALWLGGVIVRVGWNKAFTDAKIADIKTARFTKLKDAAAMTAVEDRTEPAEQEREPAGEPTVFKPVLPEITLDEWLAQVENSKTHYDILGISENAGSEEIKTAYFGMAKLFHPDRYHRETGERLRRIQVAFTGLAHAYETIKTPESREAYDYKIRKELETREKRAAAGVLEGDGMQSEQALESFEQGLHYLNDEEYSAAAAYLARAVHYNPQNALYRAYYGKALSDDENQLHKAESEMQAAAKLEPQNAKIRLMLAQFFIDRKLKKRAEGELTRFLEIAPNNKEARALLDGLQR
ncbi:MAG: DnaJ domain-containing protein [Acidobacteriota bacterium]